MNRSPLFNRRELAKLPRWALISFNTRCAHRAALLVDDSFKQYKDKIYSVIVAASRVASLGLNSKYDVDITNLYGIAESIASRAQTENNKASEAFERADNERVNDDEFMASFINWERATTLAAAAKAAVEAIDAAAGAIIEADLKSGEKEDVDSVESVIATVEVVREAYIHANNAIHAATCSSLRNLAASSEQKISSLIRDDYDYLRKLAQINKWSNSTTMPIDFWDNRFH